MKTCRTVLLNGLVYKQKCKDLINFKDANKKKYILCCFGRQNDP